MVKKSNIRLFVLTWSTNVKKSPFSRTAAHIFVSPGDTPGAITLNVVWTEREFDAYKYYWLAACAHLSITVCEIERDIGRKSSFFHTPLHSTPPVRGVPVGISAPPLGRKKLEWCRYPMVKQQNCPPLMTAVLTLPCEMKHKSWQLRRNSIANAFGFETCIKTILLLINRLINEALLVADHVSIRCCVSSLTSLTGLW